MDSPCIKQTVCKVLKIFQYGKYLVAYVLKDDKMHLLHGTISSINTQTLTWVLQASYFVHKTRVCYGRLIWAATWEFRQCGMCDQQRLRPACAYAQSDQSLCLSLEYFMNIKLLNQHNLEFLSLKEGNTGSSESIHVKMSHCWKSHVAAHLSLGRIQRPGLSMKTCKTWIFRSSRLHFACA